MNLPTVFKSAVQSLNLDAHHIESVHVSTTKEGHRKCEIESNDGSHRTFYYLLDRGPMIERHVYELRGWASRGERDAEIQRLYQKQGMTQEFIAKVMGLSQSRVSQIVHG